MNRSQTAPQAFIPTTEKTDRLIGHLIDASHENVMNLLTSFDWAKGVDRTLRPKAEANSWIYGTPFWGQLTAEQRHELLWKEIARDVSMFIWLEQILPPLYVGYINKHQDAIPSHVYEYLMIFSREEIVHTLAFRRFMRLAKLELFSAQVGTTALFDTFLNAHPVVGILTTLLIEWVGELGAMHITKDETIDPLTRHLFITHHHDESRHIIFGRKLVEDYFDATPDEILNPIRVKLGEFLTKLISLYTYNPEIASHVSYAFPIAEGDIQTHAKIRASDNNIRLNQERFGRLLAWVHERGIGPIET